MIHRLMNHRRYYHPLYQKMTIHSYHQTDVQHGIQKSNIQHSNQNSLFTFEEPQLDAESSLENIRDTNIRSFLRRF